MISPITRFVFTNCIYLNHSH